LWHRRPLLMKLAIADPPYLGRAGVYAPGGASWPSNPMRPWIKPARTSPGGDNNPEALKWNWLHTHSDLVAQLKNEYDGWAVAMYPDNLVHYLRWAPEARVAAWFQPDAMPVGRVMRSWEPVLLSMPKRTRTPGVVIRDTLTASSPKADPKMLPGAKPRAWTRWVLDMLGYDPETDTVDDLFGGSGAVAAEINQGVLL